MDKARATLLCENAGAEGRGVRIAILDTGVDPAHPDLRDRIDLDCSCSKALESSDIIDRHGHGTHIAGIVAGTGHASAGRYRGIAPRAELIIVKVLSGATGFDVGVVEGVAEAIRLKVDIINYSGGHRPTVPPPWKWSQKLGRRDIAFKSAAEAGILCVAAAGNEAYFMGFSRPGTVIRPGIMPEVLSVGSTVLDEHVAAASGRGPVYVGGDLAKNEVVTAEPELGDHPDRITKPDVVAPGGDPVLRGETDFEWSLQVSGISYGPTSARSAQGTLLPADPDGFYARMSGTSQATAMVTGLSALAIEYGDRIGMEWGTNRAAALRAIMQNAARPLRVGDRADFGHGLLTWPTIMGTLEDCVADPKQREAILFGEPRLL